jgi:ubiquitin carboxyl-terminal hydrolase 7
VDYESSREEDFFDIQLDIKGMKNVYESFDKYVETERMDGENMYAAGDHGKQDADKGVGFLSFPPVLHLHLKRFEYNVMADATVKINDRYEFPCELNLDRYLLQEGGKTEHAMGSVAATGDDSINGAGM